MTTNKSTIDYYETCESDYRIFWDLDRSMAMHAGFWDKSTRTLEDALRRENEVLAEYAQIKNSDTVLDAGCGVGGSSVFLAKKYSCQMVGITLSEKQVSTALLNAKNHGVSSLTKFMVMDFCHLQFPDHSFDVIWGLESICHALDKKRFVQEAFRVLKRGGRLIVADGFASKDISVSPDKREMTKWLNGWGVDSLDTIETFRSHLFEAGFEKIKFYNMTDNVLPSSKRLYLISLPMIVLSTIGEWIGFRKKIQTDNIKAAYHQYKALKRGLWSYGTFVAHKT
jgi:tocopherol O-methyltransferase